MHRQNERCDQLAVQAAKGKNLIPDTFFEQMEKQNP
jgi:ribonuclease HI